MAIRNFDTDAEISEKGFPYNLKTRNFDKKLTSAVIKELHWLAALAPALIDGQAVKQRSLLILR